MSSIGITATRTSTLLSSNRLLSSLNKTQSELLKRQIEISTGKRVNKPSDAPASTAAIQVIQLRLETRQQQDRNLQHALAVLNNTDQALSDASDIVLEAKSIALSQIGVGSTADTRANQATVIQAQIDGLIEIANRQFQGISLFGGRRSTGQDDQVFQGLLGGVRYIGATENLAADVGLDRPLQFNSNGNDAFAALSTRVRGSVDLNPQANAATRLADLNGAQAQGVRPGSILVTVNGTPTVVDLTDAQTLDDVRLRVNNAISAINPAAGGITEVPTGLSLTANTGNTISIAELANGQTATDLGLVGSATGTTITGADINPKLSLLTDLTTLGIGVDLTSGLKITHGKQTKIADFSTATTVQDMILTIEKLDLGLRLQINDQGTGLDLISEVSGIELSIGENAGGTTAQDLGIRTFGLETALADFSHGLGVTAQQGQDDFAFELHDGTTINVNIDGLTTVDDVIIAITTAAIGIPGFSVGVPGTTGTDFNVGLALDGNGFVFEDNTTGTADFRVVQLGTSLAATDLGINQSAGSANTITGKDLATVRVENIFTHLIALRDALENNDSRGITFAGEGIEQDTENLTRARADVGVRGQQVQQQQERSSELKISEQILLSDLQDTDLNEAITRFTQLQQQLEASLRMGAQRLQLSFLDFLR